MSSIDNAQIVHDLLNEFAEHRQAIKDMIVDLEKIKAKIDSIFPENLDKRYMRFFEEKVKSTTELFKALLDMRKEIGRTIKEEIELRRKVEKDDGTDGIEGLIDVRQLAKQIEGFQKKKDDVEKKLKVVDGELH